MTRQLPFPNTELLITSKTHRQSFLYVSHPNADPQVLRVLEWFLELRNQLEQSYMDSAACQPVA